MTRCSMATGAGTARPDADEDEDEDEDDEEDLLEEAAAAPAVA